MAAVEKEVEMVALRRRQPLNVKVVAAQTKAAAQKKGTEVVSRGEKSGNAED